MTVQSSLSSTPEVEAATGTAVKKGSGNETYKTRKLQHEGWIQLSDKKRRSTDSICLLLFILALTAMTILGLIVCGVISVANLPVGNPDLLTHSVDYLGNICGVGTNYTNKENGYYMLDSSVICIDKCPTTTDATKFVCLYDLQTAADADIALAESYVQENKCFYHVASNTIFNRCLPTDTHITIYNTTYSLTSLNDIGWLTNFAGNIYESRAIIFGFGLGVSTFVSIMYLFVLQIPGLVTVTIWGCLLLIQISLIISSILLYNLGNEWSNDNNHTHTEVVVTLICSFIGMVLSFLYFCFVVYMRKRIKLAIEVVQHAAKVLLHMPIIYLLPVIQSIALALFLIPWSIYTIYLASSGESVKNTAEYLDFNGSFQAYTYYSFTYSTEAKYIFIYLVFILFWFADFIEACGQLVVAISVSNWHFSKNKKRKGNYFACLGFYSTIRYHMGTAAFGGLIISIAQTIRAILVFLRKHSKGNAFFRYILCVISCITCLVETIFRFLNKRAYVQTAIYGYSFCTAGKTAFFLIVRNILRVATVSVVADFLLFLGKLFVTVLTVFLAYLTLAYGPHDIQGIIGPLAFIAILSVFIAKIYTAVFSMAIETMLICLIADEEMFPNKADRYNNHESDKNKEGDDNSSGNTDMTDIIAKTDAAARDSKIVPYENDERTVTTRQIIRSIDIDKSDKSKMKNSLKSPSPRLTSSRIASNSSNGNNNSSGGAGTAVVTASQSPRKIAGSGNAAALPGIMEIEDV